MTLAKVFLCEICEISKNTFFYRTPPVAKKTVKVFFMTSKFTMQSFFHTNLQKQPSEVFYKKSCLKKIANFSEKHLSKSLFLIELQAFKMDYFNNNCVMENCHKSFCDCCVYKCKCVCCKNYPYYIQQPLVCRNKMFM